MRKLLITVAAILLGLSLNAQELVRQSHPRLLSRGYSSNHTHTVAPRTRNT